jgi:uncharacterized protein (TIGR02594 family)
MSSVSLNEVHTPPWLHIAEAYESMRIAEIPGAGAHPMILKFFTHTSLKGSKLALSDETSWCSAFACTCMEEAGFKSPHSAAARDWLKWGTPIAAPKRGCVVVFDRKDPKNPNAAHVAFYVAEYSSDKLLVLGGNQLNRVSAAPRARAEVLGYRWPSGVETQTK